MTNSRRKGKDGELEFSAFLRENGIEARRGQQFHGGAGSPDVVTSLPGVHFEVKRVEAIRIYAAMEQAMLDGVGKMPVVAHRKNRGEWLAILRMDDLLKLLERAP